MISPRMAQSEFVEVQFVVEPNYSGWRLDKYLCHKIPRLSRTRVQQIIARDMICERKLKPSSLVSPGLAFRLRKRVLEEPDTPSCIDEIHRDDALIIVDKPAGLPIHPSARYHQGTLVTLLAERYGPDAKPTPIHRLDRETSGIVVCGCQPDATRRLMSAFANGEVHKEYLAICEGWPTRDEFEVDAPLAEGGLFIRIAMRVDPQAGKPSRTSFRVVRRFQRGNARFALLRALPRTGRQHQIRAHLREAGFPIVGDKIYGPDERYFDRFSKRCLEPEAWVRLRLPRHALHAARIRFRHPTLDSEVQFDSSLPADLREFIPTECDTNAV